MVETEKVLKELDKVVIFSICHTTRDPGPPLPHYCCKLCILKLAVGTGKDESFSWPKCHKETILPDSKLANIFLVNCFKAMSSKEETTLSKEDVKCEICTTSQVKAEAKITRLPVTLVVNKITFKAEVNKMSEVMLYTTRLLNNKPTKCAVQQIDCHLMSLYNGSSVETNIEEIGADQYRAQYTPTVRGRHELTVSVDGQQVAGSPFPVFVSIPLTQLDKPVKVWDGLMSPRSITVNSAGEIIMVGFFGDVMLIDQDAKLLRHIDCSQENHIVPLECVSVDSADNIYAADATTLILKVDNNCSNCEMFEVEQVKGLGHHDVAVVGDEVMLTECRNEGSIMVYDRELNYVRRIISPVRNINLPIC